MSHYGQVVFVVVLSASIGCPPAMASAEANIEPVSEVETPSLLSLSQSQPTVKCYTCVNCPTVTNETQWKTCPYHPDPAKSKKCVKYAEKYAQTRNNQLYSWVIRGCASETGTCSEIKNAYLGNPARSAIDTTQLEYCYECEGDKCNGVSRSDLDMVFAFFAVVVTPILAKYTLS